MSQSWPVMADHDCQWPWKGLTGYSEILWITYRSLILKAINWTKPEKVWIICDTCPAGIGGLISQGDDWKTTQPAAFLSKKFTTAQCNYFTYEHKTLGVLECLLKWQDDLIGHHFHMVTDHKSLEFFQKKDHVNPHQMWWQQFFTWFSFNIMWVEGELNKVVDCLSWYHLYDGTPDEELAYSDLVTTDFCLDHNREDLPTNWFEEAKKLSTLGTKWAKETCLASMRFASIWKVTNTIKDCDIEALELRWSLRLLTKLMTTARSESNTPEKSLKSGKVRKPTTNKTLGEPTMNSPVMGTWKPMILGDHLPPDKPLCLKVESNKEFIEKVCDSYKKHMMFSKVLENISHHTMFELGNSGLLMLKNNDRNHTVYIPDIILGEKRLVETIINHAHRVVGHLGSYIMYDYIQKYYWWPTMHIDVSVFTKSCAHCQSSKSSKLWPARLLHTLPIPSRPWESIAMDFIRLFPEYNRFNYLWVVIDRLTSMVHLVPLQTTIKFIELTQSFIDNIVQLHGLPNSIVSDWDSKFTSKFWSEVQRLLGTHLKLSTLFHPQTDRLSERTIQTISQILPGHIVVIL